MPGAGAAGTARFPARSRAARNGVGQGLGLALPHCLPPPLRCLHQPNQAPVCSTPFPPPRLRAGATALAAALADGRAPDLIELDLRDNPQIQRDGTAALVGTPGGMQAVGGNELAGWSDEFVSVAAGWQGEGLC